METNNGSSNVYRIELLKGADNYVVWKIKMTDILTDQGLWEYVDPGTAPSDTNQKPAWEKKDRTALSIVFAGPVAGTEKKTETEPDATKSNWTIGRGCLVWELFRLLVVLLFKYSKTDKRLVAISCNRQKTGRNQLQPVF